MNFIPKPIVHKYLNWRDRNFPVGNILRHSQYGLVFKTTNYCWYQCPHCCECSGPKNPRTYIPAGAICSYLEQAVSDPSFSNDVVFTGGEIMTAYRFGPVDYVPTLLNKSLGLGISTDIKTNAAWARAEFGEKIYQDLHNVISSHRPYSLQISLSLDRYHKNALENATQVISRLAKTPNTPVMVHISGLYNHIDMFPALIERIKAQGLVIEEVCDLKNIESIPCFVGGRGQVMLNHSNGTLFAGGRAQNMEWAYRTEFPQFMFLSNDMRSLVAFDSTGRVTLGENSGRKISTKSTTVFGPKSLRQIRADLFRATCREETRARLFDGWRFKQR